MPDHIHLLLTPAKSLEKCVQLIKGGFSFRAKKELQWQGAIWQEGFTDHRIRDRADWQRHLDYIRRNPVEASLCIDPDEYLYGSHRENAVMDPIPQWLKPLSIMIDGRAEARPLQEIIEQKTSEVSN